MKSNLDRINDRILQIKDRCAIFEKSRMSLMIASSESAERFDRAPGTRAARAVSVRVQRQFGHADDAVHRRADLVAHVGEELALGLRLASSARRRALLTAMSRC